MYSTPRAGPSNSVGFIFPEPADEGTYSNIDPQLLDDPPQRMFFIEQSSGPADEGTHSNIDPQLLNDPPEQTFSIEQHTPESLEHPRAMNKTEAPLHILPQNQFYSIEYPGYVKPTTTSVDFAIRTLGGDSSLDNAFKRSKTKGDTLFECRLRPENSFAHPVPGDVVGTNNILLKVTKRRRKGKGKGREKDVCDKDGDVRMEEGRKRKSEEGRSEFVAQAVGIINNTVRFRSECN